MTNRELVPDYPPLKLNGVEFDSTAIIGQSYNEFRIERKTYCKNADFKRLKKQLEDKKEALGKIQTTLTALRNVSSDPKSEISVLRNTKRTLSKTLSETKAVNHKRHKKMSVELHSLQHKIKPSVRISPQKQKLIDQEERLRQALADLEREIESSECKLSEELCECESKLSSLLKDNEDRILSNIAECDKLSSEIASIQEKLTSMIKEDFSEQYKKAGMAIKLIEQDPEISSSTCQQLLGLYPYCSPSEWDFDVIPGEQKTAASTALLSMTIKEDINQPLAQLIASVSTYRQISFVACMQELIQKRDSGELFYYRRNRDGTTDIVPWNGGKAVAANAG